MGNGSNSYIAKTNFTAGEWTAKLSGRTELPQFANAVKRLRNWILLPQGGIQVRPGSLVAGRAKYDDRVTRLLPFEFNVEQTYIIEAGDLYFRFYADSARVEGADKTITGVGTAGGLAEITSAGHGYSNGDFVSIQGVLGSHEVNGDWEISNVAADTFRLVGSSAPSTYTSAGTVSKIIELTTVFNDEDVFQLNLTQTEDTAYIFHGDYPTQKLTRTSATSFSIQEVDWVQTPFDDDNATATTITPGGTTVGSSVNMTSSAPVWTSDDVGRYYRVGGGVLKVTAFGTSSSVTATIKVTCINTPTAAWAPGTWCIENGFPSCGTFYDNRLTVGGVDSKPQTFWSSKTGEYENFDLSATTDDFAYEFRVASKKANVIRWIDADDTLFIGTSGQEFRAFGSNDSGITPTNINVYPQAPHGVYDTEPVATSSGVVFVQRGELGVGGPKLRLLSFSVEKNKYVATDLSILSNDITLPGIIEISYQDEPNELVWGCRSDGYLTTMTLLTEQNIIAWALHNTDGLYKSVESLTTGTGSSTWSIVDRVVDGGTRKFIEVFDEDIALDSAVHTVFGSPVTQITSGLHHLEGKEVTILGDGAVYAPQTVTNGALPDALDPAAQDVLIGLPFVPLVECFLPTRELPGGRSDGRQLRTASVVVRVKDNIGLTVGGQVNYTRNTSDDMDTAPTPETTDLRFEPDLDWNETLTIEQHLPYQTYIAAIFQYVEIGD